MPSGPLDERDRDQRPPQRASHAAPVSGRAPRYVACVQPHRGHGVTTGAYYLARALAARGPRAMVMDLTGRRERLQWLAAHNPAPGLSIWAPHIPRPERLGEALARAREQAAGKIDAILLDIDASYLERAGGVAAGLDYALIFIEHSDMGMRDADHLSQRLDDTPPPWGAVAAVFTRVSAASIHDLPPSTPDRGLPVLGELPADYLLATSDTSKDEEPRAPHDTYLGAANRLALALMRIIHITPTSQTPNERAIR